MSAGDIGNPRVSPRPEYAAQEEADAAQMESTDTWLVPGQSYYAKTAPYDGTELGLCTAQVFEGWQSVRLYPLKPYDLSALAWPLGGL